MFSGTGTLPGVAPIFMHISTDDQQKILQESKKKKEFKHRVLGLKVTIDALSSYKTTQGNNEHKINNLQVEIDNFVNNLPREYKVAKPLSKDFDEAEKKYDKILGQVQEVQSKLLALFNPELSVNVEKERKDLDKTLKGLKSDIERIESDIREKRISVEKEAERLTAKINRDVGHPIPDEQNLKNLTIRSKETFPADVVKSVVDNAKSKEKSRIERFAALTQKWNTLSVKSNELATLMSNTEQLLAVAPFIGDLNQGVDKMNLKINEMQLADLVFRKNILEHPFNATSHMPDNNKSFADLKADQATAKGKFFQILNEVKTMKLHFDKLETNSTLIQKALEVFSGKTMQVAVKSDSAKQPSGQEGEIKNLFEQLTVKHKLQSAELHEKLSTVWNAVCHEVAKAGIKLQFLEKYNKFTGQLALACIEYHEIANTLRKCRTGEPWRLTHENTYNAQLKIANRLKDDYVKGSELAIVNKSSSTPNQEPLGESWDDWVDEDTPPGQGASLYDCYKYITTKLMMAKDPLDDAERKIIEALLKDKSPGLETLRKEHAVVANAYLSDLKKYWTQTLKGIADTTKLELHKSEKAQHYQGHESDNNFTKVYNSNIVYQVTETTKAAAVGSAKAIVNYTGIGSHVGPLPEVGGTYVSPFDLMK